MAYHPVLLFEIDDETRGARLTTTPPPGMGAESHTSEVGAAAAFLGLLMIHKLIDTVLSYEAKLVDEEAA